MKPRGIEPGVNSSIVRKVLHSLYNAMWALKQETILWLIYECNLGSCQYHFNLFDLLVFSANGDVNPHFRASCESNEIVCILQGLVHN